MPCLTVIVLLIQLLNLPKKKKRKYGNGIELRRGCFSPFVITVDGYIGSEGIFLGHLSLFISSVSYSNLLLYLMNELITVIKNNGNISRKEIMISDCLLAVVGNSNNKELSLDCHSFPKKWKKIVRIILKERFNCPLLLNVVSKLIPLLYNQSNNSSNDQLYPLNSVYCKVWSHLNINNTLSDTLESKELEVAVGKLLVTIAVKLSSDSSTSVFDPCHYQLFLVSYTATTSTMDRCLLYLMFLYEQAGISMAQYDPVLWGPVSLKHYSSRQGVSWLLWKQPSSVEIINLFDKTIMKESINNYPIRTQLDPVNPCVHHHEDSNSVIVYDPSFVLPRLSHLLNSTSELDCRKFISSFCLSYLIAGTSCLHKHIQSASYHCLNRFNNHLQNCNVRGKHQLIKLMDVIRNTVVKENIRLPSILSAFFINVIPIITNQDHGLHSVITSFLSKKSYISLKDIPLYSKCLYSSGTQYVLERHWILVLLTKGIQCDSDYYLYKNKGVLTQLTSLYHCPFTPLPNKHLILQILVKASNFTPAVRDLVWDHGLLPWLHDLRQNYKEHCDSVREIVQTVNKTVNCEQQALVKIPLFCEELQFVL